MSHISEDQGRAFDALWSFTKSYYPRVEVGTCLCGIHHEITQDQRQPWCHLDHCTSIAKIARFLVIRTTDSTKKLAYLFVEEVVLLHSIPTSVVSDRDPRFTLHFWDNFQKAIDSSWNFSIARHSYTVGQIEQIILTLEDMLCACTLDFGSCWDQHLSLCEFTCNNCH